MWCTRWLAARSTAPAGAPIPPLEKIKDIYEKVCSYLQIGIGDGAEASFLFNIHDFCARIIESRYPIYQAFFSYQDARQRPPRWGNLAHNNLPDPVEEMLRCLQQHINRLDEKVQRLEKEKQANR